METRLLPLAYIAIRLRARVLGLPKHYRGDLHHHDRLTIEHRPEWKREYGGYRECRRDARRFYWGIRECGTNVVPVSASIVDDLAAYRGFESNAWYVWTGARLKYLGTHGQALDHARRNGARLDRA